jgi:TM2 domain-containing membrane protein YozV
VVPSPFPYWVAPVGAHNTRCNQNLSRVNCVSLGNSDLSSQLTEGGKNFESTRTDSKKCLGRALHSYYCVDAMLIFGVVRYLYSRGLWATSGFTHSVLSIWGFLSIALSLIAAIIALARDSTKIYGIVALVLSLFSFLFYVQ